MLSAPAPDRTGKAGWNKPRLLRDVGRASVYPAGHHEPGQGYSPAPWAFRPAKSGAGFQDQFPRPDVVPARMLGVVASTGGPNALAILLGALPATFPVPILLIQHITNSFLEGFVCWLDSVCPLSVKMAREGDIPVAGEVLIPPADRHLVLRGGRLHLSAGGAGAACSGLREACCFNPWPTAWGRRPWGCC